MTEKGNGYVKWYSLITVSVAILGILTTVSLFAFAQGIAIDERAQAGIDRIDMRSNERFNENRRTIAELMKSNAEQHTLIIGDLREIKAKMGIHNGELNRV